MFGLEQGNGRIASDKPLKRRNKILSDGCLIRVIGGFSDAFPGEFPDTGRCRRGGERRTFGIRLENGPEKSARKWELAARGDGHDRLLVR